MANTPIFTLRLNPELRKALEKEAKEEQRSLANLIVKILSDHVARKGARK